MKDKYNPKIGHGPANSFQRDFLEANLIGTKVKGKVVEKVTNKYVYTECGDKILKKGLRVRFELREETKSMLRPCTQGDTEADLL
ncbi:hypothetical protein AV926_14145 [Myroides marinus]|uniref:Uncharacterized protein n=1 Tax=Myroides marinus TaxID=703342 RepID=A0A161SBM3_9FLAO|nr:hypothetical protein [Myroides marinus]KZE77555.1 hypothetical protein AV926_14145 [Myroides marinus]